ncbi:Biotin carboxyl carrier protein of acetyl-coa carboxylase protein [Thalictrum thalictroides]|uniref:Biotin carboxyl carrier protein of acetyl-CoA carboxylase n=1 Tax=Thalictrum thalictroides TaxID=46969 RepID=A0A7J6WWR5_THATH|nr:Biotin carboxyl carrier protein of acetyl-coa carboxylase protein [Thalictrum thalictroides]
MASLVLPAASVAKTHNGIQPHCFRKSSDVISFRFPCHSKPKLRFSAKGVRSTKNHYNVVKAQLNEVTGDGSANAAATPVPKSGGPKLENEVVKHVVEQSPAALVSEASISEFMAQVSSLIKLVDSRDVVELQLKQSDCELVIRKKEALPQPPPPPNHGVMMHSPPPAPVAQPSLPPATAPAPAPVSSSTQTPPPTPPAGKSSAPHLKCPMAGTFYRCSGPGEPPFVKVGDKVKKGQVVCIIEAMKLMNEIEADRSGTIVEVLVDDGKPVSVDMPLFAISPE